jgi:hypothetical protein
MTFDRKAYMKKYHHDEYKSNKEEIDKVNKEYYLSHLDEITQYKNRWYMKNRETVLKRVTKNYQDKSISEKRRSGLKRNYNLTVEDYDNRLKAQDYGCAICKSKTSKSRTTKYLSVDHDHKTGRVRGLLCMKCNHALGNLDDNPETIREALRYILNGGFID